CGQESLGLIVALADDLEHLGVDGFRCLLAEWLLTLETIRAQERVLLGRQLNEPNPLAHAPASDHTTSQACGLLDVVFGPSRLSAVDDLLRSPASQHTDDSRAKIGFRIVVA